MKLVVDSAYIEKKRKQAHERNWTYLLSTTGSSVSITDHFGMQYIASENKLSNKDLNFIQRVNSHISDRLSKGLITLTEKPKTKTPIFSISPSGRVFKDVCEIDLNAAYWRAAYLLGFIDLATYNIPYSERELRLTERGAEFLDIEFNAIKYYKIMSVIKLKSAIRYTILVNGKYCDVPKEFTILKYRPSKEVRLISLGALDKKTEHFKYDGENLIRIGIQKMDQNLIDVWEAICHKVHSLMHEIKQELPPKDFILYWVDALVIKLSSRDKVIRLIKDARFDYKEKDIKGVIIESNKIRVQDTDNPEEDRIFKTK